MYVSTGCDFTSFFYGIGKVTFLKAFYQYSQFISAPAEHTPGSLADISPDSNVFLAFIRLVGATYFTKHMPAFQKEIPTSHFESFYTIGVDPEEHHKQWYCGIRSSSYMGTGLF